MIAYGAALLMLLTLALGSAGCGKKNQATPAPSVNRLTAQASNGVSKAIGNPKQVAAHLESLARGIKGVKGANCVVFGKYAIVGIDVDEKMERSRVGTIKYSVAEAFRKDPYGVNAVVTADIDLAQRIREIRADVKHGRPLAGFAEELSDIVGRVIPQIPRNIIPPKTPENTGTSTLNKLKK
ncbi:YhcN/YlaJ family sporulation lipoprotein [Cohnella sp. NL03-T5]|nr:YhcN/YlaJ family sporulation lipoprotein [Cohnella silvisoli]